MGVFDDKKYEELDFVSQLTRPIDSKLNEVLSLIPESIVLDFDTFKSMVGTYSYSNDLSISTAVDYLASKYAQVSLSYTERNALHKMFRFEFGGEDVIIDFEQNKIFGDIKLVKLAETTDEKVLESILGRDGIDACSSMSIYGDAFGRANEILELLGKSEKYTKTRSAYKKRDGIRRRLVEIFKANEWDIRDTELANKVGFWIRDYVTEGNLAALSNFCRLKVMTHKNQPIYSMEEVE